MNVCIPQLWNRMSLIVYVPTKKTPQILVVAQDTLIEVTTYILSQHSKGRYMTQLNFPCAIMKEMQKVQHTTSIASVPQSGKFMWTGYFFYITRGQGGSICEYFQYEPLQTVQISLNLQKKYLQCTNTHSHTWWNMLLLSNLSPACFFVMYPMVRPNTWGKSTWLQLKIWQKHSYALCCM